MQTEVTLLFGEIHCYYITVTATQGQIANTFHVLRSIKKRAAQNHVLRRFTHLRAIRLPKQSVNMATTVLHHL